MGKYIDRAALMILGTAGLYLFFLNAWHSIPLACAAAFACGALLMRLAGGRPARSRLSTRRAGAELLRIAALPDAEAARELEALIRGRYPAEDYAVAPLLKHPESTLSCADVLNLWKAHRGMARVAVAATCDCDPRAALYARELRQPALAIVDRRQLTRLIRARGEAFPQSGGVSPGKWLRRVLAAAAVRRPGLRDALAAAMLLLMYFASGRVPCLVFALALLFWFGAARIRGHRRRRLFEA